jgi:hypothetical protein
MKFIWGQSKDKARRFTFSGLYRKTQLLEQEVEQDYYLVHGNLYSGQLPLGIIDIEGRERAKKDLDL